MKCDTCGNEYENCFTLSQGGETYNFDCFECAIHTVAPTCAHCGCKVIGHGVSRARELFCCDHCARVGVGAADDEEDYRDDEGDDDEAELEFDDDDELEDDEELALDPDEAPRRSPRR